MPQQQQPQLRPYQQAILNISSSMTSVIARIRTSERLREGQPVYLSADRRALIGEPDAAAGPIQVPIGCVLDVNIGWGPDGQSWADALVDLSGYRQIAADLAAGRDYSGAYTRRLRAAAPSREDLTSDDPRENI